MAIINSYPNITELKTGSLLLVSDTSVEGNPTKTAPISDIISLIPPLVPGGGTVTSVTSGDANTITIGGTAADPTVAANTAAVTNGSNNLATGDQIYDFVTGGATVTGIGASNGITVSGGGLGPSPVVSIDYNDASNNFINQAALGTTIEAGDKIVYEDATDTTVKKIAVSELNALVRPYLVYSALITQTGTSAPTAVVLENTIPGTMTWSYSDVGEYLLRNSGTPFTANKVQVFVNRGQEVTSSEPIRWVYQNTSDVFIKTQNISGVNTNGLITNGSIEIRIYS